MTSSRSSKVLALTGFMGCGKTTVGRMLARLYDVPFFDLDSVIEMRTGVCVKDIFGRIGEYGFRAIEHMTLEQVLSELTAAHRAGIKAAGFESEEDEVAGCSAERSREGVARKYSAVLSLGGGTLTTPECAMLIKRYTKCVWLKASPKTLLRNLSGSGERPLLRDCPDEESLLERINCLLTERAPVYKKTASLEIDTDTKSPEEIAREILKSIEKSG